MWKSKKLLDESIKSFIASNNSVVRALNHINTKLRVNFDGSRLKQKKWHLLIKRCLIFILFMR